MGHHKRQNGFSFQYACIQAMLVLYPVSSKYIIDIACKDETCSTGEFFNRETRSCKPCKKETFLNLTKNLCFDCKICTVLHTYEKENISMPCSTVLDDAIDCDSGFLQANTENVLILCERCSACPSGYVVKTECDPRDDTLCAVSVTDINPPAPAEEVLTTTNSKPTVDNDSEQIMSNKSFLNNTSFNTTTKGIQEDEYRHDGLDQLRTGMWNLLENFPTPAQTFNSNSDSGYNVRLRPTPTPHPWLRTPMNATNSGLNKNGFRLSWPWVVSIVSVIMVFTFLSLMTLKFRGKLKCSSVCRRKRGFTRLRSQGPHTSELEEYVEDIV